VGCFQHDCVERTANVSQNPGLYRFHLFSGHTTGRLLECGYEIICFAKFGLKNGAVQDHNFSPYDGGRGQLDKISENIGAFIVRSRMSYSCSVLRAVKSSALAENRDSGRDF
jgi:hypothetical protein